MRVPEETMAHLDRFLQAMIQKKAGGLTLESGSSPALSIKGASVPVSSATPSAGQILKLLEEVVAPSDLARFATTRSLSVVVNRDGIPPVRLEAVRSDDFLKAEFTPLDPGTALAKPAHDATSAAGSAKPAPETSLENATRTTPASASMATMDDLFRIMVSRGASDLHISSEEKPILRVDGGITRIDDWPVLDPVSLQALLDQITPKKYAEEFRATRDTDFAYEIPGLARFRCNLFADRKGPGGVFRVIPSEIMTAEDLSLSPHILDLCRLTKGLVLVTGPTGSGKSTTLCALIDYVNRIREDHIITIEDPIEFVHENKACLINQREVGNHTDSFKKALRAALREDPDIVLIGEMRDLETIAIAIETAETGHLVFGTLHTTTAISTVDRIIDQFPPDQQAQIRVMLAESLKGVISQTLCRKIGGGRIAALEVLVGIPAVVKLIREGKTFQVPSIMQTGKKYGMVTLNDALVQLVKKGMIEPDEAYLRAVDKLGIVKMLKATGKDLSFLDSEKELAGAGTGA